MRDSVKRVRRMSCNSLSYVKILRVVVFTIVALCSATTVQAGDLKKAEGSALSGVIFDDKPLSLPVQRNFQMAMITASSEVGRSCGAMEAYGWRMGQTEQSRVNQIFNGAVDQLRAQGYNVETRKSNTISRDITMFTADSEDKHLLFMWSAGDIGLVLVMCETSAPIGGRLGQLTENASRTTPVHGALSAAGEAYAEKMAAANQSRAAILSRPVSGSTGHYSMGATPIGDWVGTYSCSQGATGGTLTIDSIKGDRFEGKFSFYPSGRNMSVPRGSYAVYGDYDASSNRILINPGKWIQRPPGYYNTIMIGSFDVATSTFSGYFQGITGCTSFEAHYVPSRVAKAAEKGKDSATKADAVTKKKPAKKAKKTSTLKADKTSGTSLDTKGNEVITKGIKVGEPAPSASVPSTSSAPNTLGTLPSLKDELPASATPSAAAPAKDTLPASATPAKEEKPAPTSKEDTIEAIPADALKIN